MKVCNLQLVLFMSVTAGQSQNNLINLTGTNTTRTLLERYLTRKLFYFSAISLNFFTDELRRVSYDDVKLLLFTRENPIEPKRIDEIDRLKYTKFIVHGWGKNITEVWNQNLTREYLKKGDFNIVQVDWSVPASRNYFSAAVSVSDVGKLLAQKIASTNIHPSLIHIIGHSLGAHVTGIAGREIGRITGHRISRITCLDAAKVFFENNLLPGIRAEDAQIVDAIHTDGDVFGIARTYGTVDFYPNSGRGVQPGCGFGFTWDLFTNFTRTLEMIFCSHTRSNYYFINSINHAEEFVATKCNTWNNYLQGKCNDNPKTFMGDAYVENTKSREKFFLRTKEYPLEL